MYKVEILEDKKVLHITTGGLMKEEEILESLNKLKQVVRSIKTSEYNLIIDTSDLNAIFQSSIPNLKEVMEIYDKAPFAKKILVVPKSSAAKMQIQKADTTNLPNYLIRVNSYEEALSMIK